jgi:hypothetical protein
LLYAFVAKVIYKLMHSIMVVNEGMVVNKVVDYLIWRECLVLKVDFEKAYDSNGWGLFDYLLRMSEFSDKWREDPCLCRKCGFLWMEVQRKESIFKGGLNKETYHLSHFLFLLVVEIFSGSWGEWWKWFDSKVLSWDNKKWSFSSSTRGRHSLHWGSFNW